MLCLHLQVEPTQLGLIDRASLCLRGVRLALSNGPSWVGSTWRRRQIRSPKVMYHLQNPKDISYLVWCECTCVCVCVCVMCCTCATASTCWLYWGQVVSTERNVRCCFVSSLYEIFPNFQACIHDCCGPGTLHQLVHKIFNKLGHKFFMDPFFTLCFGERHRARSPQAEIVRAAPRAPRALRFWCFGVGDGMLRMRHMLP
jgi:hypothetical protein